jgi:ABC-type transport system involved in multi-copper enzyme maturation permease subunit
MSLLALRASLRKELLINVRSWRVLTYALFLAAVILLGSSLEQDSFPYELSLSQGPLVLLLVLGCSFIFGVDSVSREHEKGTAPLIFGTPARRGQLLGAKALVPVIAWLLTLLALAASYLAQGMGNLFATLWLIRLGCATLLFFVVLALQLLLSAAMSGKGAAFAGLVIVLFVFFTSGYLPVGLGESVLLVSPGYHEYLAVTDLMDGTLDSPVYVLALLVEALVFSALAFWSFKRSEVVR